MTAPAPTRAEEGRETGPTSPWKLHGGLAALGGAEWLDAIASKMEAGGRGLNPPHLLATDVRQTARIVKRTALSLQAAEAEVARLTAALKLCLTEMDWQIKSTNRCGDPNYECPLQDIHKPSDSHAEARHAARTALEAPHADK